MSHHKTTESALDKCSAATTPTDYRSSAVSRTQATNTTCGEAETTLLTDALVSTTHDKCNALTTASCGNTYDSNKSHDETHLSYAFSHPKIANFTNATDTTNICNYSQRESKHELQLLENYTSNTELSNTNNFETFNQRSSSFMLNINNNNTVSDLMPLNTHTAQATNSTQAKHLKQSSRNSKQGDLSEQSEIERIISRFSFLRDLLNVSSRLIRFRLNTIKPAKYRLTGAVTLQETHEIFTRIIRALQLQQFKTEINLISQQKSLPIKNSLAKLSPFLDEAGILRVGGRLQKSSLSFDQKHPILLIKCDLTKLIFEDLHRRNFHAAPQALLSFSRQQYWILGGRVQAKHVVHHCQICFRSKPKLLSQVMADISSDRTQPTRAFQVIGIDYCGPFDIKPLVRTKVKTKGYVLLITCFATRSTHVELVHDLTTTSFLNALRRFISRRGIPHKIWSDNATNFLGGRRQLSELRELLLSSTHDQQVHQFCNDHRIHWLTIPARSPHWGGLWESMVKQLKHHLKRELMNSYLQVDEMETLLIQIEAVLNSRPLTPLSDSPNDYNALTPGHFLIGQPLNTLPEPSWSDVKSNRLKAWQRIQKVSSLIWKRFQRDYISELQRRNKWLTAKNNLKPGTLVLLHDDLPSTQWRLGRVVTVHTGPDGHVRSCSIQTSSGNFTRSVVKIAPLPYQT